MNSVPIELRSSSSWSIARVACLSSSCSICLATPLQVACQELRFEVQASLPHARAGEDPLCELVVGEAEALERLVLAGKRAPPR